MSEKESGGGCGVVLVCIIVISLMIWGVVSCRQARIERERKETEAQIDAVANVLLGAAAGLVIANSQNNSSTSRPLYNRNSSKTRYRKTRYSGYQPIDKDTSYYSNGQYIGRKTQSGGTTTYEDGFGNTVTAKER